MQENNVKMQENAKKTNKKKNQQQNKTPQQIKLTMMRIPERHRGQYKNSQWPTI